MAQTDTNCWSPVLSNSSRSQNILRESWKRISLGNDDQHPALAWRLCKFGAIWTFCSTRGFPLSLPTGRSVISHLKFGTTYPSISGFALPYQPSNVISKRTYLNSIYTSLPPSSSFSDCLRLRFSTFADTVRLTNACIIISHVFWLNHSRGYLLIAYTEVLHWVLVAWCLDWYRSRRWRTSRRDDQTVDHNRPSSHSNKHRAHQYHHHPLTGRVPAEPRLTGLSSVLFLEQNLRG